MPTQYRPSVSRFCSSPISFSLKPRKRSLIAGGLNRNRTCRLRSPPLDNFTKIPYFINVPASAIDACPAEQCVRHFFCFPALNSGRSKGAAKMLRIRINVYEEIQTVYYFSALTTWIPERAIKHLLYIHALRTVGMPMS